MAKEQIADPAQTKLVRDSGRREGGADRIVLAAERTYAAWVRAGLAALAAGISARALLGKTEPKGLILTTASLLILFSAFCFVAAIWRRMIRATPPRPGTRRLPSALLIVVNGLLLTVSIAALAGIWLL